VLEGTGSYYSSASRLIMSKKVSFIVLSDMGSPIKQLAIPKFVIQFLCFSLLACVIGAGFLVYEYHKIKMTLLSADERGNIISNQQEEIADQRLQIQNFALEINKLKKKLVGLNDFEKKIRVIGNIEKPAEQDGLFGVGGSIPEDIKSRIPITEKHNSLVREMHDQTNQLDIASAKQGERFELLLKHLEGQRNLLACTPAIRPLKGEKGKDWWFTSKFGYRVSPLTQLKEFHKGYDLSARKGTPIIATADGVVSYTGRKGLLGKTIVVDHGHGMRTRFAHCSKILKKRREKVKRGDVIALVGNSGRSTGPHLHYEVHLNGMPVNPKKYILN